MAVKNTGTDTDRLEVKLDTNIYAIFSRLTVGPPFLVQLFDMSKEENYRLIDTIDDDDVVLLTFKVIQSYEEWQHINR